MPRRPFALLLVALLAALAAPRGALAQASFHCTSTVHPRGTRAGGAAPHESRCAVTRAQCNELRRDLREAGQRSTACAPRREAFCYAISLPGLSLSSVECAVTQGQCRALRSAAMQRAGMRPDDVRADECLILDPRLAGRAATSPARRVRSPDAPGAYCHDERTRSAPCARTHRACLEALRYERATLAYDDAAVRCTPRASMHCFTVDTDEGPRCYRARDECAAAERAQREAAPDVVLAQRCVEVTPP